MKKTPNNIVFISKAIRTSLALDTTRDYELTELKQLLKTKGLGSKYVIIKDSVSNSYKLGEVFYS